MPDYICGVCKKIVQGDAVEFINHTQTHIIEAIKEGHPDWVEEDGLCPKCLDYFNKQFNSEN